MSQRGEGKVMCGRERGWGGGWDVIGEDDSEERGGRKSY